MASGGSGNDRYLGRRILGAAAPAGFVAIALACIGCGQEFQSHEGGPPTDGLVLWLTADRGVTEQNGAVSVWADQSGQHSDALQTGVDLRPMLDRSAFSGMGAIAFDGQDDFMKLPVGFADFTQGLSFFSTFAVEHDDLCTALLEVSNGSEIDDIDFGRLEGRAAFEVLDGSSSSGTLAVGSPQLYSVIQHTDASVAMRVNGSDVGTATIALPANILRQDNYVGNTLYSGCSVFGGRIGEMLLYDHAVGDRELLDIEAYLGKHAGCCQ